MKALLSIAPGGPETLILTDVPDLTPGPGQAVIQVKACGVNFPDALILQDKYQFKPQRPFAPGGEVAGIVKAVGAGVTGLAPGQRVLAHGFFGGMAEQIALDAGMVTPIPDGLPFDEAAALVLTYGTVLYALKDRGDLRPGQSLLVLGAAGGIGLAAIELGKALGARVTAAASSPEKVAFCKAHGADEGLVYGRGPFDADGRKTLAGQFKQAGGAQGFDVICDAVGGDYAEAALRAIAWEGRHLVVGFAAGEIPRIPLNLTLLKGCQIVGVFWGGWVQRDPQAWKARLGELFDLCASGAIRPRISARYPLERGGEAIAHLAAREALGKVVVTVD